MPEYDRLDISKEIDINKTNASKECNMSLLSLNVIIDIF